MVLKAQIGGYDIGRVFIDAGSGFIPEFQKMRNLELLSFIANLAHLIL
jgi:hypothetical protein